jgi:protein involved in polysaccharide export with SLBB domain
MGLFHFLFAAGVGVWAVGGCEHVRVSSNEQLQAFSESPGAPLCDRLREFGDTHLSVDQAHLMEARLKTGPYRVGPEEVLDLTLSSFLGVVTSEDSVKPDQTSTLSCRINEAGSIFLPVVGELAVAGKSLPEIEAAVISAYYPKYAKTYPSVFVKISEYKKQKVSITGAVKNPGIYELQRDQMSLVALIMQAGGITEDGAAGIRIERCRSDSAASPKSLDPSLFGPRTGSSMGRSEADRPVQLASIVEPMGQAGSSDLTMSFKADRGTPTRGWLTVGRQGRVMVREHLDVASADERSQIAQHLAWGQPGVVEAQVDRQLYDLSVALAARSQTGFFDSDQPTTLRPAEAAGGYGIQLAAARTAVPAPRRTMEAAPASDSGDRVTVVLPIKGINVPFADVPLYEGDRVTVERLVIPVFSVIGLVQRPGNFPYPPDAQYTLAQAIAFGGGVEDLPEPRYIMVYRLQSDGTIIHATYELAKLGHTGGLDDPATVLIRPGDIVAIEQTPRTRTTKFLKDLFHVNIGAYIPIPITK